MKQEAPGDLELVRSFVNTLDLETGADELRDAEALARWLAERRLLEPGAPVSDAQVQRVAGEELDPDAIATLEAAVRWGSLTVVFDGRGRIAVEHGRPGVGGAVGRLLAIAARSMADGSWDRLKACSANDCGWAFYDRTRNRSGRWCSMAVCGNRAKVRAYRALRASS